MIVSQTKKAILNKLFNTTFDLAGITNYLKELEVIGNTYTSCSSVWIDLSTDSYGACVVVSVDVEVVHANSRIRVTISRCTQGTGKIVQGASIATNYALHFSFG